MRSLWEKRLWLLAGGWLFSIYASLYFVRAPIEFLRERGLLGPSVVTLFVLLGAGLLLAVALRRPGRREALVLVLGAGSYVLALSATERPEERLHFVQYGVLAALVYSALVLRASRLQNDTHSASLGPALLAISVTFVCGWVDEGIQYLLPNRVYDLRDVGLNLLAGTLAVVVLFARRRAKRQSGS